MYGCMVKTISPPFGSFEIGGYEVKEMMG